MLKQLMFVSICLSLLCCTASAADPVEGTINYKKVGERQLKIDWTKPAAVSYTHLTLSTIHSV